MVKKKTSKTRTFQTKPMVDPATGEVESFHVEHIERDADVDSGFTKLFMSDFLKAVECVANGKMLVCLWIMEHTNTHNQLLYSQRDIATMMGVSIGTVNEAVKRLVESGFMRKASVGYMINPDILFRGVLRRRREACRLYADAGKTTVDREAIESQIRQLDRRKARLEAKLK